jgi:ethanolamine ammonia-lyase large subunit
MLNHAAKRTGQYGLYIETGQGADFTNGNGEGFDMVVHESRKYGFVRALKNKIAEVQLKTMPGPWVHVNDVAGFIGPEVFKSREQLVRCCLEDTVMGKLHGLTIGLDVCSTLHMDITLDDLEWCIDQIMPANPAYLMALPTKNDPMLSYLTTGFNDHVRIRSKFGYKVNDAMWDFFRKIEVIGSDGNITEHFGDPVWVYFKYRIAKGDKRSKDEIYAEGRRLIAEMEGRGVPIAQGYGKNIWDLEPKLDKKIHALYDDSKICLWKEMPEMFIASIPNLVAVQSTSTDRKDYIYHPPTGEILSKQSVEKLVRLGKGWNGNGPDVQIIISDGLNVSALTDEGHLKTYLEHLNKELVTAGLRVSTDLVFIRNGRVRAGYRCGEYLFGHSSGVDRPKGIIHIIGERPGSGHHNFSAYLSAPLISVWKEKGKLDHNYSKVVSGISDTALNPLLAAKETVKILAEMFAASRKLVV